MRGLVAGVVFAFLLAAPAAATSCPVNATITLHGEIIIPPVIDGEEWFWPGKFAHRPCQVMTLRGRGKLPTECVVGKRMALTGHVIEDGILILDVATIRCF